MTFGLVELRGFEPLTSCMPSTGRQSTRIYCRRPPSRHVPPGPAKSAPVAVLPCCTTFPVAFAGPPGGAGRPGLITRARPHCGPIDALASLDLAWPRRGRSSWPIRASPGVFCCRSPHAGPPPALRARLLAGAAWAWRPAFGSGFHAHTKIGPRSLLQGGQCGDERCGIRGAPSGRGVVPACCLVAGDGHLPELVVLQVSGRLEHRPAHPDFRPGEGLGG